MKHPFKILAPALVLCASPLSSQATDAPDCQVLIVEVLEVKDAGGEAQMVSYFPATDFMASAQDEISGHISNVNGQRIRALMCTRNDIIPAASDYDFLATGIPFVLSQNFDSPDTDSLTLYWKDGQIEHVYKGHPLSEEAQAILDTRLAEFSDRGLNAWALAAADAEAEAETQVEAAPESENEIESEAEADTEDIVIISFDESDQSDVINTTSARPTDSFATDEIDSIEAEEISFGNMDTSEATQLNIQTKIEIEE